MHVDEKFQPVPGSEFELKAELVLLAMGFVHPVHEGLLKTLGVDLDPRGNVRASTNDYQTSIAKVFSSGDMRRGPIARGLGDPRRPPVRSLDRSVPDGLDHPASLIFRILTSNEKAPPSRGALFEFDQPPTVYALKKAARTSPGVMP